MNITKQDMLEPSARQDEEQLEVLYSLADQDLINEAHTAAVEELAVDTEAIYASVILFHTFLDRTPYVIMFYWSNVLVS